MDKKIFFLLIMSIVAILAVGSVSASEDLTIDDVQVDDISVNDVSTEDVSNNLEEIETRTYDIDNTMNSSTINNKISTASSGSHVLNFAPGNYSNIALILQNNVVLNGNGAVLFGDGSNNIFTVTNCSNFTISGFVINVNSNQKAAIYGSDVKNMAIINNNIIGGKDGINIFKTYENVTITGNTITNVIRDAISLVNHKNFTESQWSSWAASVVSGNIISGGEYGMFFGGNFKGEINNNQISGSICGMEFAGKKAANNGRLSADLYGNTITGVTTGINMFHPKIHYLNLTANTINVIDSSSNYAIQTNGNFDQQGSIYVYYNNFTGLIKNAFIRAVGSNYGNNTGF